MKTALIVYIIGSGIAVLRLAWRMHFKLDKYDWAYGGVWKSFFLAIIIWPFSAICAPLLVKLDLDDQAASDHREEDRFRNRLPPCGLYVRYRPNGRSIQEACGEFVFKAADVELAFKTGQKENPFFRDKTVHVLLDWLKQRNEGLGEATEIPHYIDKNLSHLASLRIIVNQLVKAGYGKVWCSKCGEVFLPSEVITKDEDNKFGWNYERLYCPKNHQLLATESTFRDPVPPRRHKRVLTMNAH